MSFWRKDETVDKGPTKELIPSLEMIVKQNKLKMDKINMAFPFDEDNNPCLEDRHNITLNDGQNFGKWHVPSLGELFRGTKEAPKDIDHYPADYYLFFYGIERNVIMVNDVIHDIIDEEFIRLYSGMKRRPDGRSEGFMHDVIWQSAALVAGMYPLSQVEFEAIFGQLAKSVRGWKTGYSSRNYINYLQDHMDEIMAGN
ncbi:MAG: hypothetical protein KAR31_00285 [Candidatus Omnitrophica bacterium]|nr:hypothetical protein [Candidatus Omnitrophota bacterium]